MPSPFNPRDVEVLAAALPGQADNPVGRAARNVLVVHTKRCTPGHYSQLFGTGPAFRDIFFGGVQPSPYESAIAPLTGLDDGFFTSVAVAVLCQQMGLSTSRLRPQITMDRIAADLGSWNARLTTNSYRFYAYMAGNVDGPIRSALAAFPDPAAKQTAKEHYLAGLTSAAWINAKIVQDASQQWFDRDWELFHHWIKLTALGAEPAEIDRAIGSIIGQGLHIPAAYGAGQWRERSPWFGPGLAAQDAADAVAQILATRCHAYPGGGYSCMPEDNSFEFTANSQPGTHYRQLPKSSCFAPGTRVVKSDGSLVPIEQIEPGDELATPDGPRAVLLRAETRRAGRVLQRFAGTRFAFSATHPFVSASGEPGSAYYAAADPDGLTRAVPMLAPFGISPLLPGRTRLVRYTPEGGEPWPVPLVEPDPGEQPDLLYDLVLAIEQDGRSEYYAGDERVQTLVSSEVPRFGAAPDAAWVLLRVLESATPAILEALEPVSEESFADLLNVGFTSLSRTMMAALGPKLAEAAHGDAAVGEVGEVGEAEAGVAQAHTSTSPAESARAFARGLAAAGGGAQRRPTMVFEQFAADFAGQVQAALAMGWRSFELAGGDVADLLAVDLYDLELFRPVGAVAPVSVEVALVKDTARFVRSVPVSGPGSVWYLTADGPAYFPEWSQPAEHATTWDHGGERHSGAAGSSTAAGSVDPFGHLLWELEIRVPTSGGVAARLPLPASVSHGYGNFEAPLLDPAGTPVGRVRGDIRLLTTVAFADEWEARKTWRPADQQRIARRLAQLASPYISDRFKVAIEQFRFCAATTRTP